MADLASLQRRFLDRVAHGAPAEGLVATGDLDVYAGMYAIRLHDVLVDDYPKLHAALGAARFEEVAAAYVRAHPPHSFTLRDLGIGLPEFLRTTALAPAWAAELAALERARMDVFDGPDAAPLAQAQVIELGERLPELALAWVPSSVVVPLTWAVDDLWSAIEDGEPAFEPAPAERVVLVWRRELAVLHRTLDGDEGALAPRVAAGARFAELCELLGGLHGDDAGSRAAELLLRWLHGAALAAPAAM